MEHFGTIVKALREERGMTATDLAHEAGVTEGYVRQIEKAWATTSTKRWVGFARYPTMERIERIAAALGVEPGTFVEYRLGAVRRLLSEFEPDHRFVPGVGLDEAAANLAALEELLAEHPRRHSLAAFRRALARPRPSRLVRRALAALGPARQQAR